MLSVAFQLNVACTSRKKERLGGLDWLEKAGTRVVVVAVHHHERHTDLATA